MIFFVDFLNFFDNLVQQLEHIESIYHHYFLDLYLLFYFLAIQENLYMICFYLNLFYEDYNAINQHYQKEIHFLSFFLFFVIDTFAKEIQKVL